MTNAFAALTGLRYSKGHGTGNDFVLLADPDDDRNITSEQAEFLCDRRRGIGGDGLIRAVHSKHVPEGLELLATSPDVEWFMDYRNGDGSLSEMCGNGVRVFVQFLLEQGLVALHFGQELSIGTRAGVKVVRRTEDGYCVDMGPWTFIHSDAAVERGVDSLVETVGLDIARPALSISMGNPHTVVALADMSELEAAQLHTAPVVQPLPVNGTNVEFAVPAEPLIHDGVAHITMRVHERGVGETLSCGTGACAAAAATRVWAGADAPNVWRVSVPGGEVRVEFVRQANGSEHVELTGPAVIVTDGVIA